MRINYLRRIRASLTVFIMAAALAGCGSALKELEQIPEQEAVVVAGVKAALVREPLVDAAAIRVDIVDGKLVLEGYVDSAEESRRAVDIANQNAKGLNITDRLEVR